MKKYIVIEKQVGETPLMAITKWKNANSEYAKIPASYAGRLDPMAHGKLLILLGEECKRQKEYTDLDKEYEIEVLLDIGSDTGDALGLVSEEGRTYVKNTNDVGPTFTKRLRDRLPVILNAECGTYQRAYPKFSSKTVQGIPLFLHTLQGTIDTIQIPEHEEKIYGIKIKNITQISAQELSERIEEFLSKAPTSHESSKKLGADFRIKEVRASWEKLFTKGGEREFTRVFTVVSLRVTCGSGTYMRSLAGRIGEALGTRALALSIHRTKIGIY